MRTMFACVPTLLRSFFPPLTNVPAILPFLPPHKSSPYFPFLPPLMVLSFSSCVRSLLCSFFPYLANVSAFLPSFLHIKSSLPSLSSLHVWSFLFFTSFQFLSDLPLIRSFLPSYRYLPWFFPSYTVIFLSSYLPLFLPSFQFFLHRLHMFCLYFLLSFHPSYFSFLPR